jgi:predicted nucleotidyltransferase
LPGYKPAVPPMLDITAAQQAQVQGLLHLRLPHTTALAFGSRVLNWPFGRGPKPYSDLDIALFGLAQADAQALAHLRADLEESPLPWRVDISDAKELPSALRELVEQRGVPLQCTQDVQAHGSSPAGTAVAR